VSASSPNIAGRAQLGSASGPRSRRRARFPGGRARLPIACREMEVVALNWFSLSELSLLLAGQLIRTGC